MPSSSGTEEGKTKTSPGERVFTLGEQRIYFIPRSIMLPGPQRNSVVKGDKRGCERLAEPSSNLLRSALLRVTLNKSH